MFKLPNSLLIGLALRAFMLAVRIRSVRRGIRVKYSEIEKRGLKPTTPKTRSLTPSSRTKMHHANGNILDIDFKVHVYSSNILI